MLVCIYIYICIAMFICWYVCICIYIIYIAIYICWYVYIYIYTHTHIDTNSYTHMSIKFNTTCGKTPTPSVSFYLNFRAVVDMYMVTCLTARNMDNFRYT
jgi:hypothetical protein